MGKIATEQEAYSIGKVGTPVTNKCCTKARAEALGCAVSGSYTSNKLVQKTDLSQAKVSYKFEATIGINNSVYESSLKCAFEFRLNGVVVHEEQYIDTDDSRDIIYASVDDIPGKTQSIRIIPQSDSTYRPDSDASMITVDYLSGSWKDYITGHSGSFSSYLNETIIINNDRCEIIYQF